MTTSTPYTIDDLAGMLTTQSELLNSLLRRNEALNDLLEELITKVDEINLPSGEGFSTTYES